MDDQHPVLTLNCRQVPIRSTVLLQRRSDPESFAHRPMGKSRPLPMILLFLHGDPLEKPRFRLPVVWWKHVKTIRISAKYDDLIEFYINESIYHLFLHLFNYVVSLREAWVATHWQLQRPRGEFPPRRFTRRVRVPVTPQRRRFGRLV